MSGGDNMEIITMGEKFKGKYSFRETCFGIVRKGNEILIINKDNQYSLVGGGIEEGETLGECLKREFLEETGYIITNYKEFICLDCYWLADNKYPLLSRANIFEVEIDFINKKEARESNCYLDWIDINEASKLLPLPYQRMAIEWYTEKYLKKD